MNTSRIAATACITAISAAASICGTPAAVAGPGPGPGHDPDGTPAACRAPDAWSTHHRSFDYDASITARKQAWAARGPQMAQRG
jgi:hypothetical protein